MLSRASRHDVIEALNMHLRIARPVTSIERSARQYAVGLDLTRVGQFVDHHGFDGVMLGMPDAQFHLEFTRCRTHPVEPSTTAEDLLVLYVPATDEWARRCEKMLAAGFTEVEPFNPYWKQRGRTFRDADGYHVVIQNAEWRNAA
jgi:hypothetical protein